MQNVEFYRKKLKNAEDLQGIVQTMKILSSVSIRQFDKAAASLSEYFRTIEMGLQIVVRRSFKDTFPYLKSKDEPATGIIVLGSSMGMCGTFDEQIIEFVENNIKQNNITDPRFLVLGDRAASHFEHEYGIEETLELPGSVAGINGVTMQLLVAIEKWRSESKTENVLIFHHKTVHHGRYLPRKRLLLPLDRHWLDRLAGKPWPTNNLPQHQMDPEHLFLLLIRQYLLVSLYSALAESLAAEHMSRLNSMTMAEQKIKERLSRLTNKYRIERQNAITEELLDILSGYEAVKGKEYR